MNPTDLGTTKMSTESEDTLIVPVEKEAIVKKVDDEVEEDTSILDKLDDDTIIIAELGAMTTAEIEEDLNPAILLVVDGKRFTYSLRTST